MSDVMTSVADTSGRSLLAASTRLDEWVVGPVYSPSANACTRSFSHGGKVGEYHRDGALLDSTGAYFERPKPYYEDRGVSGFLYVKDFGAVGDTTTDNTGKVLFVSAGSYYLTGAVTVPAGVKMVGEAWWQLIAQGPAFSDETQAHPNALHLIFTAKGATAGAVLIEWTMTADAKGSAGLWDCHARVGGATGTNLTPAECPALTFGIRGQPDGAHQAGRVRMP
ncbi:pectin lyase-like protein [Colletotrichum falcatum]|nr:pectin lyase-like protein [Colletotrichum falcatum]